MLFFLTNRWKGKVWFPDKEKCFLDLEKIESVKMAVYSGISHVDCEKWEKIEKKIMAKDVKKLEQELDSVNSHLALLRGEFVKEGGPLSTFSIYIFR